MEHLVDWEKLSQLSGDKLKQETFKAIQKISFAIQSSDDDEPSVLEAVPRLFSLVDSHPEELNKFHQLISSMARATGLWNYIDVENADVTDVLVASAVTSDQLGGITLHREQVKLLTKLLDGENVVLSAPTSFGKSLLIDALLASGKYKRVAIVLPTIALLDEFRRRFSNRFGDKFDILMHQSEVSRDHPTIFLGTQERLIYRDDIGNLDLTVVDEFYKLDPHRKDQRFVTLNAAVYKLLKKSRQFFFLGPNIDTVTVSKESPWKFNFISTRFSTVAVDTLDLRDVPDKRERLLDEIGEQENWPALVFVSSPDKANKLAIELSEKMAVSDDSSDFARWLQSNIGPNNFLSRAVLFGFGVHHGRIPRAIAAQMVRHFDQQKLPVLLCTSTLIEGVNTAARTVMIFDKAINNEDYDFFTFANIRGRAGRLGQHHVGKVMVFNDIPEFSELDVSPTMFGDDDEYPDEYIVHIDEKDRSSRSDSRFQYYREKLGLEGDDLKLASSIGLDAALELRSELFQKIKEFPELVWSGWPQYHEIQALCKIVCTCSRVSTFGAFSDSQLTFQINMLRQSKTFKAFLLDIDDRYKGPDQSRDNIFKFLRACEYGLPQHFSLVELFLKQLGMPVDYSHFISGVTSWFRAEVLKELDEEGIPVQISERFYRPEETKQSLKQRLVSIARLGAHDLTDFERQWILDMA
ncbi:DEAD/DEAH box helicase [Thalassospira australica]|uniref:DEAD/DEAH box helicase n=1 Tax=Thalassospira australica TaxID=1528106 RepID=UPI00385085C6